MASSRMRWMRLSAVALLLALLLAACGEASTGATPPATPAAGQPTQNIPETGPTATAAPPAGTPAAGTPAAARPGPGPGEFQNPVLTVDFPDPHVIQVGDTFYAYATNAAGRNIMRATSPDLVTWTLTVDAMASLPSWAALTGGLVWAPEVMQIGDKFLMYYTARDKASNRQCVGVSVSDTPDGRFRDTRDAPLVCQAEEGGTIDAHPFRDGEKLYLYFKNDGNCCAMPTWLYVQEMAPDGLSLVGEPTRLIRNEQVWEGNVIEAPTMWKHEDRYYLFYSANSYAGLEYAAGYALCESPTGPCEKAPENPILKSVLQNPPVIGPGHQTLLQLGDQTWIIYHAWEVTQQGMKGSRRMMWIDRLDWEAGKPVLRGPTTGPQPRPEIPAP